MAEFMRADLEKCQKVLEGMRSKFTTLDKEFVEACEKAGASLVGAMVALSAVHIMVGEKMTDMLEVVLRGEDDDELTADDEEE